MTKQTTRFQCSICGKSIKDGIAVYRNNEPGEMPPDWRCREHYTKTQPIDPIVLNITQIIADDDNNARGKR